MSSSTLGKEILQDWHTACDIAEMNDTIVRDVSLHRAGTFTKGWQMLITVSVPLELHLWESLSGML